MLTIPHHSSISRDTTSNNRRLPSCLKKIFCPSFRETELFDLGDKLGFMTRGMTNAIDRRLLFRKVKFT